MDPILKEWIERSLYDLFNTQDNNLIERNLKEECINHRFAFHLENNKPELYSQYYIDIDYNKKGSEKKTRIANGVPLEIRPDILIHKRTDDIYDNLVAFECKKGYLNRNDKEKLIWLLKNGYNYRVSIGIGYRPTEDRFLIYEYEKNYEKPRRVSKSLCKL